MPKTMTKTLEEWNFTLARGGHPHPSRGAACFMEAVALFAGEESPSDKPSCVAAPLRRFGILLNDEWGPDQRQELVPFIPRVLETAGDGKDEARCFLALDWVIRESVPEWLAQAGLIEAAQLRALEPITGLAASFAAVPIVREVRRKGYTSRAARSATYSDVAEDAIRATGALAALEAVTLAGGSQTKAAARTTGQDAAGSAMAAAAALLTAAATAGEAHNLIRPTIARLQASVLDLYDRMIDPTPRTATDQERS